MKYNNGDRVRAEVKFPNVSKEHKVSQDKMFLDATVLGFDEEANKYRCRTFEFGIVLISEEKIDAGMKQSKK